MVEYFNSMEKPTHHSLWKMNFQCSIQEPTISTATNPSASDLSFHLNKLPIQNRKSKIIVKNRLILHKSEYQEKPILSKGVFPGVRRFN